MVAASLPHTWACPSCGRRVPLRAPACHCGMTQARAQALTAAAAPAPDAPPAAPQRARISARDRREAIDAMTGDVKLLLGLGGLVLVLGLGYLVFGPKPAPMPAVLGYVDAGPPPVVRPKPSPTPPFKLPWWK